MSCFVYVVLSRPDIFLIYFLSTVLSDLFPRVILSLLLVLLLSFCLKMLRRFSFVSSFLLVVVDFLSAFPVKFPIQVLSFCSCFFGEPRFFHRLISLLHRVIHLIIWCFSLRYVLMIRLFFPFPPWLFSSLCFSVMVSLLFIHNSLWIFKIRFLFLC